MKSNYSIFFRSFCLYVAFSILFAAFYPTAAYALTAGPASPEFSSFTPVSSTEMVNSFTGDFAYNLPVVQVPGPHGSGYSLSLSYNSGSTAEMEASWVGFGWNLSPGSINRSVRGLPDDYDGQQEITYFNKTRPNWTATSTNRAGMELMSKDLSLGLSYGTTHRINNYTGYQKVKSFGANFNGCVGLDVSKDVHGVTYRPYVSPVGLFNTFFKESNTKTEASAETDAPEGGKKKLDFTFKLMTENLSPSVGIGGLNLGMNSFSISLLPPTPKPFNYPQYQGISINWSASLQFNPSTAPIGMELGKMGTFSYRNNKAVSKHSAYGYNHTNWGKMDDSERVHDYYVEKDRPYHVSDYFIGIPYSSQDIYNVSGEGVAGSFQAFLPQIGHWSPRQESSETRHRQMGFEVMIGSNIGAGLDFGAGYQKTTVSPWYNQKAIDSDPDYVSYRFSNDMGGQVFYGDGQTNIQSAGISDLLNANNPNSITDNLKSYDRDDSGSSAYIKEIRTGDGSGLISGMEIINKDGVKMCYSEPLKVRNETSLTVNVDPQGDEIKKRFYAFSPLGLSQGLTYSDFRVEDTELKLHQTLMGQINPNEYASSFLLTEILTPSYIDADQVSGPSDGDFGGWTKFSYRTAFGGDSGPWYRYRMPFAGLHYQQNSISDPKDDTGSMETGEKQVKYLKTIETKTHVAYFVTNKTVNQNPYLNGSGEERYDGVGAKKLMANGDPASVLDGSDVFERSTTLEYLEKIVLFAKGANGEISEHQKPLKTVRFEYDYSLVPNVANNTNSNFNYYQQNASMAKEDNGKLTLRKVWFEYEGVVSANISPYVFDYHYPAADGESKLAEFFSSEQLLTDDIQNPPYAPFAMDAWGNRTPNSEERRANGVAWVDQSAFVDETLKYDPAAYQLKSIRLPSGGSIYVQYESKDYAHVHDRTAMAMARVTLPPGQGPTYNTDTYYINVEDLGVNPANESEVQSLAEKIKTHYLGNEQEDARFRKVYYKFLFSLLNDAPSLDNYRSEYITGYADLEDVKVICLDENGESGCAIFGIEVTIGGKGEDKDGGEKSLTPRMACWEFVANQRQGKIAAADGVEPEYEKTYDDVLARFADEGGASEIPNRVIIDLLTDMALGVGFGKKGYQNISKEDERVGKNIAEAYSFLKLPVLNNKYAGGARVKRILLHDPGIESGDEVVQGTEYSYVMEDGITSSGVATNEPGLAREENPLVDFMPRKGESWWNQLVSGEVLDQLEGPVGEAILPGASVGYRRVVSENIHKGKTGNGFTIDEYYTVYDFPFDKIYHMGETDGLDFNGSANASTPLAESSPPDIKILTGLFNYIDSKQSLAQGYRFVQVNMHGQQKRNATYSGDYNKWMSGAEPSHLVAGQSFEYFEPGEHIRTIQMDDQGHIVNNMLIPGKEVDIARESKFVKDVSMDFSVEIDISVGLPLAIFVGVWPSFTYSNNELYQHATTKMVSYPSILKSVTTTVEGISSRSENIAFDKFTGDPLIVKNSDSYTGSFNPLTGEQREGDLYSFSVPASWIYKEMGQKAVNSSNTNQLNSQVATFLVHNVEPDAEWLQAPENLISAVVNTYSKEWGSLLAQEQRLQQEYPGSEASSVIGDMNKKWLPNASYTYKTDVDNQTSAAERGLFSLSSSVWDETLNFNSQGWLKSNETKKYSPNSEALEQVDVLGIPSAVMFGNQYGNNVPVMVAQNADYNSILFRDFENAEQPSSAAHSGRNAGKVQEIDNLLPGVMATSLLKQQGGVIQFWMNDHISELTMNLSGVGAPVPMSAVASVDGWTLYQGEVDKETHLGELGVGAPLMASLQDNGQDNALDDLYIDDIRFQPLNAVASTYVYEPYNYRLMTQFDDQHFGTYFQYNKEGQLVRKIIETERGKHTLQEMHYNIPKVKR